MTNWFDKFSPKQRRFLVLGSAAAVFFGAVALLNGGMTGGSSGQKRATDPQVSVFTDKDTRNVSLGELNKEITDLHRDLTAAQLNEKNLADNNKALSDRDDRLTKSLAELGQSIADIRRGGTGASKTPVLPDTGTTQGSSEPVPRPVAGYTKASLSPKSVFAPPGAAPNPTTPATTTAHQGGGASLPPVTLAVHRVTDNRPAEKLVEPERKTIDGIWLPPGSIIHGELLNGADMPTGDASRKDPMPVLVRVSANAILPNEYGEDIRECFLLMSGYGDLASERSYIRGETVSCVNKDGSAIEAPLKSYSVGEDGKDGIRGNLVSKQGTFIARALMVGIMQGFAQGLSKNQVEALGVSGSTGSLVATTGNGGGGSPFATDAAQGVGHALDKIASYYISMAKDIFPVIEIDAGRQVDIVVEVGTKLRFRNV